MRYTVGLLTCVALVQSIFAETYKLVNSMATMQTQNLYNFLVDTYGKRMLAGQVNKAWLPLIESETGGKQPAIMGYDYMGFIGGQGADTPYTIDWVTNSGGIAHYQWHWICPDRSGDMYHKYGKLANALNNPGSSDYNDILRDLDAVAGEMKKLQDAGVPILWRPLHEAEGGWFWWGMEGKDPLQKLYRLMYDRYTNYHGLNNLIWMWVSYGWEKGNWYPGDDVVDIVVWDYEEKPQSWNEYQSLFAGHGKLFGIAEEGTFPDPNDFASRPWLFVNIWDYMIQDPSKDSRGKNTASWLYKVYNDPRVMTLSDLPNIYNASTRAPTTAGPTQAPTTAPPSVACTDIAPDNVYTCSQQASWGKCSESFMQGFCLRSCGMCSGGCTDIPPDNVYTCYQQASWGKCGESFMQGFCLQTCGKC
jgi:mannan endo-1,4-beta-mannosidase